MKTLSLILFLILFNPVLKAQLDYSIDIGLNVNNLNLNSSLSEDIEPRLGYHVSTSFSHPLSTMSKFNVQLGFEKIGFNDLVSSKVFDDSANPLPDIESEVKLYNIVIVPSFHHSFLLANKKIGLSIGFAGNINIARDIEDFLILIEGKSPIGENIKSFWIDFMFRSEYELHKNLNAHLFLTKSIMPVIETVGFISGEDEKGYFLKFGIGLSYRLKI